SSVLMTCAALGLLLRVSYELDRAQRQVAKLRGDGQQASVGGIPATTQPSPATATASARGTSRLRQRVEPVPGKPATSTSPTLGLRKGA
ncbi:MAG: hypothetical protein LC715_09185, partial [Gammaproteobacteria bacterium]|nr:hypothetical protein [Gammaproteobacteria bacterium]